MALYRKQILFVVVILLILTVSCDELDPNKVPNGNNGTVQSNTPKKATNTKKPNTTKVPSTPTKTNSSLEKAKELNTQGYDLYKQGKYQEAFNLFKKSIETNNGYYLSHYNFACTVGVLMKKDYETWYNYRSEAIDHLWTVKKLNPNYIQRIKTDSDLEPFRKSFDYYRIIGLNTQQSKDVKEILCKLDWYIQGPGLYTVLGGITFKEDQSFTVTYYDLRDIEKDIKEIKYNGKYKVEGNKVTLNLTKKMLRKRTIDDAQKNYTVYEKNTVLNAVLSNEGVLQVDIFKYPFNYWYDEFSA